MDRENQIVPHGTFEPQGAGASAANGESWTARYGQRHRQVRIDAWPPGFQAPQKVRIYRRNQHFLLQWWEPSARQNLSEQVDGDLIDAVAKARQIDQRLCELRSSGKTRARLRHEQFIDAYRSDLQRRADAGEVRPSTAVRYGNALNHYLKFITGPGSAAAGPYATGANRTVALQYAAHLATARVAPNGNAAAQTRRMLSPDYAIDVARALYAWGSDPDRGNLLPDAFRNPFVAKHRARSRALPDLIGEPDISLSMTAEFLSECDLYQLRLFCPLVFYGLRPAEPCYLFFEYVRDDALTVPCEPELDYVTKGRRGKTFPLLEPLQTLLVGPGDLPSGLMFLRRRVFEGLEKAPLQGRSLQALIREYQRRVELRGNPGARQRESVRNQVLGEAGALNYDRIEHEFHSIARRLKWPKQATLKDFRHGFATSLANAGVPEPYRKYLMGQRTDGAAIHRYTHLDQVREQYMKAVETQWPRLVQIVNDRLATF